MKALLVAFFLLVCLGSIQAYQEKVNTCNSCVCKGIANYWHASLLPADEFPRVNSSATAFGSLILSLETLPATATSNETLALRYHLFIKGNNFNAAHIHVGSRCTAGPIVAFLAGPFLGNGTSFPTGGLLEGILTAVNLTGPLAGFTINDLVEEIKVGNAYVNAHTLLFPSGEARGQIQPLQEDSVLLDDLLNATICTGKYNNFLRLLVNNATTTTVGGIFTTNATNLRESEVDILSRTLLSGAGPYTVFAPTDASWNLSGGNWTRSSLERYIVSGAYTFSDFLGKVTILTSLSGVNLTVDGVQSNNTSASLLLKAAHHAKVTVNGVKISKPDAVIARNGVLQGMAGPIPDTAPSTTTTTTTTVPPARRFRRFQAKV